MQDAEFAPDIQESERKRKLAQLLLSQSAQPSGQMVGNVYVKPALTQRLAGLLNAYSSQKLEGESGDIQKKIAATLTGRQNDWMNSMPGENVVPFANRPEPTDQNMNQWAMQGLSLGPDYAKLGLGIAGDQADRSLKAKELEESRKQHAIDLQTTLADRQEGRDQTAALQRELHTMDVKGRTDAASIAADAKAEKGKTLPPQALKLQNDELTAIGTASSMEADMGALEKQIDDGKLVLGPLQNKKNELKNWMGQSDDESTAYSSFKATLEKIRNDSLRLNSGVQTEGDAIRAMNELLSSLNDPKLVKQRLGELKAINKRGAELRRMNVDVIRANYGAEPLDISGYTNQPSALGSAPMQATVPAGSPKGWSIKKVQ